MELRDLEHFAVVAEELHFGRAAQRLHIVPAAVSQRVRALEHELGVVLFERTSRRVALTDAGTSLLPVAGKVLGSAREVVDTAAAIRDGVVGRVRVGFAPGSAHLIDELTRLLAARDDEVTLVAESMWSLTALAALEAGDVALALVRDPLPERGVETREIAAYRDDHVAVSREDPLADQQVVDLAAFEGRGFLLNERETAPRGARRDRAVLRRARRRPGLAPPSPARARAAARARRGRRRFSARALAPGRHAGARSGDPTPAPAGAAAPLPPGAPERGRISCRDPRVRPGRRDRSRALNRCAPVAPRSRSRSGVGWVSSTSGGVRCRTGERTSRTTNAKEHRP